MSRIDRRPRAESSAAIAAIASARPRNHPREKLARTWSAADTKNSQIQARCRAADGGESAGANKRRSAYRQSTDQKWGRSWRWDS
jgi:hypothetical protein